MRHQQLSVINVCNKHFFFLPHTAIRHKILYDDFSLPFLNVCLCVCKLLIRESRESKWRALNRCCCCCFVVVVVAACPQFPRYFNNAFEFRHAAHIVPSRSLNEKHLTQVLVVLFVAFFLAPIREKRKTKETLFLKASA